MAIAIVLVLIVLGSILFHAFSPWWWTPIASNWGYIDETLRITFWITGAVFAAVILFMAYCVWVIIVKLELEWSISKTFLGLACFIAAFWYLYGRYKTFQKLIADFS